jgi:hypothetical protein
MPALDLIRLGALFAAVDAAIETHDKGRAFEDLIAELFAQIPGMEIIARNVLNVFDTEEIDIALWNDQHAEGLYFLPYQLFVECKNWSHAVGSAEVAYFIARLGERGSDYGFLFAANGVTGDPGDLTRAHFQISSALSRGKKVIVITRADVEQLTTTEDFVRLVKQRLCQLMATGTSLV